MGNEKSLPFFMNLLVFCLQTHYICESKFIYPVIGKYILLNNLELAKITLVGTKYYHAVLYTRKNEYSDWDRDCSSDRIKVLKKDRLLLDEMPKRLLTDTEKAHEARKIYLKEFAAKLPEPPEISEDGFMDKNTFPYRNGFLNRVKEKYLGKNKHIYKISKWDWKDEVEIEGLDVSKEKFSGISYCYAELVSEYAYQVGMREGVRMYLHRVSTMLEDLITACNKYHSQNKEGSKIIGNSMVTLVANSTETNDLQGLSAIKDFLAESSAFRESLSKIAFDAENLLQEQNKKFGM